MTCFVRNQLFDFMRKTFLKWTRESFEFYADVEDRLFMEEYEDPDQEF